MFFKKKKQDVIDSTLLKKQIMEWATKQNINIHMLEILLGDYRDVGKENRIGIFVFFENNKNLEEYNSQGLIFDFKKEVTSMINNSDKEIIFEFDTHENVELKCNGNYIKYSVMKNSEK